MDYTLHARLLVHTSTNTIDVAVDRAPEFANWHAIGWMLDTTSSSVDGYNANVALTTWSASVVNGSHAHRLNLVAAQDWSADYAPYRANSVVWYDSKYWLTTVETSDTPGVATWAELPPDSGYWGTVISDPGAYGIDFYMTEGLPADSIDCTYLQLQVNPSTSVSDINYTWIYYVYLDNGQTHIDSNLLHEIGTPDYSTQLVNITNCTSYLVYKFGVLNFAGGTYYNVGDFAVYDYQFYMCIGATGASPAADPASWQLASLSDVDFVAVWSRVLSSSYYGNVKLYSEQMDAACASVRISYDYSLQVNCNTLTAKNESLNSGLHLHSRLAGQRHASGHIRPVIRQVRDRPLRLWRELRRGIVRDT